MINFDKNQILLKIFWNAFQKILNRKVIFWSQGQNWPLGLSLWQAWPHHRLSPWPQGGQKNFLLKICFRWFWATFDFFYQIFINYHDKFYGKNCLSPVTSFTGKFPPLAASGRCFKGNLRECVLCWMLYDNLNKRQTVTRVAGFVPCYELRFWNRLKKET